MGRSIALLVNPVSGRRDGDEVAARVTPIFTAAGIGVQLVRAESADEAMQEARSALASGVDALVVVGGDGMIHLATQLVAGTGTPLGIVPAGTGNDVARMLGLDPGDPEAGARAIVAGRTRDIDLAETDGRHVVTVIAAGFDAKVNERANAMTRPRGPLRYTLATLVELGVFKPLDYTLVLDGRPTELSAMLVAVGNGPSYGGGLRICDGAELDDGLLDVVVIGPMSKLELLRVFPRLAKGTHVDHRSYSLHRVREVSLSSPGVVGYGDGERLGPLPLRVRAEPDALRVFVPSVG